MKGRPVEYHQALMSEREETTMKSKCPPSESFTNQMGRFKMKEWKGILQEPPSWLTDQARGFFNAQLARYHIVARNMMTKMGWQGGPLGTGTGIVDPIESGVPGGGRAGLGHPSRPKPRKPTKRKESHKDNYMGFINDAGVTTYCKVIDAHQVELVKLSSRGKPILTGLIMIVHQQERRNLLWSQGGIVGVAESTYPHLAGWTFEGADKGTLETFTVRQLTAIFRDLTLPPSPPTCVRAWQERLGEIDFHLLVSNYVTGLLTPNDYAPHFKNILHRRTFVRHINPKASTHSCRCCRRDIETTSHLGVCPRINEVLNHIWQVTETKVTRSPELNLFAISSEPLPRGVIALHLIVWKFILIAFSRADIMHEAFDPDAIWKGALRRLISRIERVKMQVRLAHTIADSRNTEDIHGLSAYNKQVEGLGAFNDDGSFKYTNLLWAELNKLDLTKYSSSDA